MTDTTSAGDSRAPKELTSELFPVDTIELDGHVEHVVHGGRNLFGLLPQAFATIKHIGVIGWGSQGPAQAQNLRDSLAGTDVKVTVGLREGSASWAAAEAAGFTETDGTLGEMFAVIAASDLTVLLISDAAQARNYKEIFAALQPGSTLGLSHGFLLAHLRNVDDDFPDNVNVIAVCPKGMGPSVRRLYEQGRDVNGAGINTSVAVYRDLDGRATDVALGWAIALGAPYTFWTTLESEFRSDVFGERGILLGATHAVVESLYRRFTNLGDTPERAFERACECVTGPLAATISKEGLRAVRDRFEGDDRKTFDHAYTAAHRAATPVLFEIYDEVASGNEIRSVVLAGDRLARHPMSSIDGGQMWEVGRTVRAARDEHTVEIDPFTAGVFCGTMIAQVDVLVEEGHPWSEIVNESIIEAVDSLIPYMHARGVGYMVDNCSTTARLGSRKWGPRFEAQLNQVAFPVLDGDGPSPDDELSEQFDAHPVHEVLATISAYRPSIDISVT